MNKGYQTPDFSLGGIERKVDGSALVPMAGHLPYSLELRSSKLLDVLLEVFSAQISQGDNRANLRKKINSWLYVRTRPGIYLELNNHLHLAYADQRDGSGTQHWWRLFFDDRFKEKIEAASCSNALTISKKTEQCEEEKTTQAQHTNFNSQREWGGMYFRSESEIKIAEKLDKAGVLFFANARGRISGEGSPRSQTQMTGRIEVDFLVFCRGKFMILEVDGQHHQNGEQTLRDYRRDRILLREGIPTVRFTAEECFNYSTEVVSEFLKIFNSSTNCG
jgi:very-short-patch-repair endonuclease